MFVFVVGSLQSLVYDARQSLRMFDEIKRRYPESDVVKTPFSSTWGPLVGAAIRDESVRDGVSWIRFLESHINDVNVFCLKLQLPPTGLWEQELYVYLAKGRTGHVDVAGDLCLKLLRDHYQVLASMLTDYATRFIIDPSASPTISGIEQPC